MKGDISFNIGESFKKGDLIVKIDDKIEYFNMKSRKSTFLNSVAGMLPDLRISLPNEFEEWNTFMENINVDNLLPELPEISTTQERIFMASRNILTNYYSIKSAEANFESYHIYAPFAGTITEVNLQVGAVANPGSRLGKIINTINLELEVPIGVEDAKWIKIGERVKVHNKTRTSSWNGKVVRKSQNVNPTTQSIYIYVSIHSTSKNPLYKGEYLAISFGGIKLFNVMEIPRKAVFNQNEVFIVQDGLLVKKEIKIKKINKDKIFFSGLEDGVNIVVEPLINATENTKVEIL
jgi:RND family efflux transporter MFP subunit